MSIREPGDLPRQITSSGGVHGLAAYSNAPHTCRAVGVTAMTRVNTLCLA